MKIHKICLACLCCILSFHGFSQSKWSAEFRPQLNFPTEIVADANVKTGFGFEVLAAYNVMNFLAVYGGWGWGEFRGDETIGNNYLDMQSTGFNLGLQFNVPLGNTGLSYFLRGGGVYHKFEMEDEEGNVFATSGYGPGWQLETGIEFGISTTWSLRPGIKYRTITNEMDWGGDVNEVSLNYFSVGLGLAKRF